MKTVAFFLQHMLSGGVENSLINLLRSMDASEYNAEIYLIREDGSFTERAKETAVTLPIPMPEKIRKTIPVGGTKIACREALDKKDFFRACGYMAKHVLYRHGFSELDGIRLSDIPELGTGYDIAVCYHIHSPFLVWYVAERVRAGRKEAYIHNDFITTGYDIRRLKKYTDKYDSFHAVSGQLRDEFTDIFPEYSDITDVRHNIVPAEDIRKMADEYVPPEFGRDRVNILTVGRLEEQKGIDIAIKAMKFLSDASKADAKQFCWYVIGEGTEKKKLQALISRNGLADCFRLLGSRQNPYPYFKNCDVYVQPSRHEGYVTTVTEALIFRRPIISTEFAGAHEQLDGNTDAIIISGNADEAWVPEKIALSIKEAVR